ncbi:hypothetical protein RRG08_042195 [Elysia crispata]|uniref:Uncharacterized protein n=1 Tax=Elysia crispata TaxID=231223 RepID=A0AAE0YGB9_9GAST|nr:hypothetical protein RRG08_042195 [Elysia crispata]
MGQTWSWVTKSV